MIKQLLFLTLSCLFLAAHPAWYSGTSNEITLEECQINDLDQCEIVFVEGFSAAYSNYTNQQLGVDDKKLFLHQAFEDAVTEHKAGLQKMIVAKIGDKVVGLVGFKPTEIPDQIYISQLAVHPDFWRKGIGKKLVSICFDLYENPNHLVVIPRRINESAKNFYLGLGFIESDYMHPGYDPAKYVGYEWKVEVDDDFTTCSY